MAAFLHQGLFTLIALVAIAELILTAFLFAKENETHNFPNHKFQSLLIFYIVNAAWSTFFGCAYAYWIIRQSLHFLASVATSVWWLLLTAILWGVATGLFHSTRTGGICDGLPPISRCRQSLTIEALGWTEFGLCLFTVLATWHWVNSEEGSWRGSWYSEGARESNAREV